MSDFIRKHLSEVKSQAATIKRPTPKAKRGTVNKSRLAEPSAFYGQFDITLKGGSGWQLVKCAFHDDTHASMGVNREHGGYKCHACGASGDRIGFYMQWHSVSFIDACRALQLIEEA